MNNTLLLMALLGLLLNLFKKIDAGKKLAKAGNASFSIKGYFSDEWASIVVSVIAIFIVVLNMKKIGEIVPERYYLILSLLFVFVGYCGSDVIIYLLGKSRKLTLKVIDRKTNELDSQLGSKGV